jgi:hypothetical protein
MRTREPAADGRGVSEVISFVLVFSLIAATVALVYVSGIGGLESTRSSERVTNAERAFDVLQDNIADIHREGAPSRATEIKLSDAQMTYGESTRITVQVENLNETNASVSNVSSVSIDPIVYAAESGPELVYSNGAVFRQDRSGTVLNTPPGFLFTDDGGERTAIVPTVQTRNRGVGGVGNQGTILVRTLLASQEVEIAEDNPSALTSPDANPDGSGDTEYNVTITIETAEERQGVWLDYLNGEIPDSQDIRGTNFDGVACEAVDDTTVECSIAVENVYSSLTRVDVTYD